MAKISIALPAHNEEKSIFRTLNAIYKSDVGNNTLDITICLSACKDGTESEIKRFGKEFPDVKIKVISDEVGGKARALKFLDKYIDSDIILFIDSDCSPNPDAIYKLYSGLKAADDSILINSGNSVDPRYTDKNISPKNLIDAFNRIFWQRSPRKIINGQFFAARKSTLQVLPDEVKLDDIYTSIYYWDKFIKDDTALLIQGSPAKISEVINYQKNIVAGKRQIEELLKDKVNNFGKITKELYGQFDIKLSDRPKYYPNISYYYILLSKVLVAFGELKGRFSKPSWSQTKGSKEIATTP